MALFEFFLANPPPFRFDLCLPESLLGLDDLLKLEPQGQLKRCRDLTLNPLTPCPKLLLRCSFSGYKSDSTKDPNCR